MKFRTAISKDASFTTRAEDGELYIEGYFAVYNSRYDITDAAYETIDPGAFDGQLTRDIRALTNHDHTLVLGRTTAGTLTLRLDERGLWGSIRVNQADRDAMNLYERVKRRDVTQCSIGFDILEERCETVDGVTIFHICRVTLYEVSVVTFPAYADTSVHARMRDLEADEQRKTDLWRRELRRKLKGE